MSVKRFRRVQAMTNGPLPGPCRKVEVTRHRHILGSVQAVYRFDCWFAIVVLSSINAGRYTKSKLHVPEPSVDRTRVNVENQYEKVFGLSTNATCC